MARTGHDSRPVLLLTASIAPAQGVPNLQVTNPQERAEQYLQALRRSLAQSAGLLRGVVFAENTGADLAEFRALARHRDDVEFVCLRPTPEFAHRGRGWLETQLVAATFEDSRLLAPAGAFAWKLTGRYQVENLRRIIDVAPTADLHINLRRYPQKWADMWLYGTNRHGLRALTSHLDALREDLSAQPSETALFDILQQERRAGLDICPRLRVEPRMSGRRGYDGASYASARQRLKWATRAVARRVVPGVWL